MKTHTQSFATLCMVLLSATMLCFTTGYQVGDEGRDFSLKNIDGKMLSMKDMKDAKGVILVFTCNHCPFSKAYEERIIALDKKYAPLGYPVIAINPNDKTREPEDSFENMQIRAKEKGFSFPYLYDETQEIAQSYGATRTPHVYVLKKEGAKFIVKYIGAIDDNSDEPEKVTAKYAENAVDALLANKAVATPETKAIGCGIKWKAQ
ncbi:MAG: thioredoxin family protein [Bacteroidetes bacterium]|nr:thioredoxin family protein [Bacteroidota bacterium]